jgi:hypothetical protein
LSNSTDKTFHSEAPGFNQTGSDSYIFLISARIFLALFSLLETIPITFSP